MAAPVKRTHVEVSTQELLHLFTVYTKNRCNWPMIVAEMKQLSVTLPENAKNLYKTEEYGKLKRRLSDQLKKMTKPGAVIANKELEKLVKEVQKMEGRYSQQMARPSQRKDQLKKLYTKVPESTKVDVEVEVEKLLEDQPQLLAPQHERNHFADFLQQDIPHNLDSEQLEIPKNPVEQQEIPKNPVEQQENPKNPVEQQEIPRMPVPKQQIRPTAVAWQKKTRDVRQIAIPDSDDSEDVEGPPSPPPQKKV